MPTVKGFNDVNIYYEIHGNGEPLLLIMGLGGDISEYKSVIGGFAKNYQVIAFDNRGAGRSDKPSTPYSMEIMAHDAVRLLDELGIAEANVLGISMGGRIALAFALNFPERVKRLILVCTFASRGKKVRVSWAMRLLYPLQWLPPFRSKYPQPRYAFKLQRQATLDFDVIDRLHEIKAPTLILHGRNDKTVPFERAEILNNGICGSKLVPFKGGHLFFIMRERQRFLDEASNFINSKLE